MSGRLLWVLAFSYLISLDVKNLSRDLVKIPRLGVQVSVLLIIIFFIRRADFPGPAPGAVGTLVSFLGAYLLNRFLREPRTFFITVFSLTLWLQSRGEALSWRPFAEAWASVLGLTLFLFLIVGLRRRLVFAAVPRRLSGLPAELILLSLLALAFSWLERLPVF